MRIIALGASNWTSCDDFYDAIFAAIGAPEGHGRSVDAFIDSMIWGGMNSIDPPYTVRVSGTEKTSKDVRDEIVALKHYLAEARDYFRVQEGHGVDVNFEVLP